MLSAVKDTAYVAGTLEEAMASLRSADNYASLQRRTVPAVKTINDASTFSLFLGCLPVWARPLIMSLPVFRESLQARKDLGTMAVTAVLKRIGMENEVARHDFITKLLDIRDAEGKPMDSSELSSESLTLLIAGSDTISKYVPPPATILCFLTRVSIPVQFRGCHHILSSAELRGSDEVARGAG